MEEELSDAQEQAVKEMARKIVVEEFRELFELADGEMSATGALDYWMFNKLDMTYNEIADVRQQTRNAVNGSLQRARDSLYD